jgi:hypothetical protein
MNNIEQRFLESKRFAFFLGEIFSGMLMSLFNPSFLFFLPEVQDREVSLFCSGPTVFF